MHHNIKLLYAIGDSFSWGSELGQTPEISFYEDSRQIFSDYKKNHVFSYLISKKFNIPNYINAASPAASNQRTHRVLIHDICKLLKEYQPNEIFVLIGLSSPYRREFCHNDGSYLLHLDAHKPPKNTPARAIWEILGLYFNNEADPYVFDAMNIFAIQNFLRLNKIPYMFTTSMRDDNENLNYSKYVEKSLYEKISSDKRYYPSPSFTTVNAMHGLPRGEYCHPLEEGHKVWAEELCKIIEDNNFFSSEDL